MAEQGETTAGSFWADRDLVEDVVQTSPVGITVVDGDGDVTFANERAMEIYGRSREELEDFVHDDSRWDLVDEDGEPIGAGEAPFDRVVEGAEVIRDRVVGLRRPSGERVWVSVNGAPQRAEDGELERAVFAFEEITERKQRERELREMERRYQAVFEDPNILVGLLEPDGTVVNINQTAMEYIDADLEAVTGEPFWETPWWGEGDDVRNDVREWVERAAAGEYVDFEVDLTRPDGEPYTISGYFRPVTDDDGEVVSIIVSDRDVTERKERERELEESERRYRTLVEQFPNGSVGLYDEDLTYTAVGGELLEELGHAPEDVVGTGIAARYPEDLVDRIRPHFLAVFEGESRTFEIDLDGRHLLADTAPVRGADDEIHAGMLVVQDITERKEREQALQASRNQLRALIDVLPVAVFVAEADGRIVEWNDAAEEIWGGEIAESESVAEYDRYEAWWADTGEPVEPEEWPLARALEGEEVTDPDEIVIKGFDGKLRTVLNHGMPVRDADGEVSRAVVTLVDITERKEYQRRLEASNERLEQFAYAASHDLQEPLRMVSSYLQMIENRYADALDADGREFLEFAVDGADRMREMIDALLEYSRVETQGDPLEPVDLGTVLGEVLEDLQFQIEETDAAVTADDLPVVEGDPNQLRQVLQNLMENAIEYSGDGPPRVHVSAERDGSEWVVSVEDEGIGIDPDDQERIFEVFQRLHTADEYEGVGIGLALAERIVERHGGDIRVDSEPGEGTTFSFTLPAVDGPG